MSSNPLAGWEMVAQAAELAAARGGLRARHGGVAARTVVRTAGISRALVTAAGEIRGWIGGACAEPIVIREAQRAIVDGEPRLLLLGTPEQFGHVPDGHDRHPDRVPERGRDGGVHRAGRVDAASRRRRPVADDSHAAATWLGARMARRARSTARTSRGPSSIPDRSWWWRRRGTVTKKRSSTR